MRLNYIPRRNIFEAVNYGYLYNWYAATDVREIANVGWSVPSNTEQQSLATYLGGTAIAGGKLKEVGLVYWNTPNTGATNEVGFNGRGAGARSDTDGIFSSFKDRFYTWSSTNAFSTLARIGLIENDNEQFQCVNYYGENSSGYSIRLIKDSTSLTHGQTGTYTGNDGKVYPTICIGTQEWLAANLKETKYRDGSLIPVVTDNAEWAALTTGARCVYDNLESNA